MSDHHVTLKSVPAKPGRAPTYQLTLDGEDISSCVTALNLSVDPCREQRLELYLAHHPLDVDLSGLPVVVDADMHDLLVRLGWTPPAEDKEATG